MESIKVSRDRYLLLSQYRRLLPVSSSRNWAAWQIKSKEFARKLLKPEEMRKILRRACYRVFEIYDTSLPFRPPGDGPLIGAPVSRSVLQKLAIADSQSAQPSMVYIPSESRVVKTSPLLFGICHPAAVYFIVAHRIQ